MATDGDNVNRYIREARKMEVEILPPDINLSDRKFVLTHNSIRYGLDTLRGVGSTSVTEILRKRPFRSLADFIRRVDGRRVGKTQVEALIAIGAFDTINPDRTAVMTEYHDHRILEKVAPGKLAKMTPEQKVVHVAEWRAKHDGEPNYLKEFYVPDFADDMVVYEVEKLLVGNFITVDPMERYAEPLAKVVGSAEEVLAKEVGAEFYIGGQVTDIKVINVKKKGRFEGREMAFIAVTLAEEDFEVTAFPDQWDRSRLLLKPQYPVILSVTKMDRGCSLNGVERLDLSLSEGI
jgi:DNA polymerase-3 subunit alpha